MYIPELDALIFLATEFLEGDADRPALQSGVKALYEAAGVHTLTSLAAHYCHWLIVWLCSPAGTGYRPGETPKRCKIADRLARRGCINLLEQLGLPLQVRHDNTAGTQCN